MLIHEKFGCRKILGFQLEPSTNKICKLFKLFHRPNWFATNDFSQANYSGHETAQLYQESDDEKL